MIITNETNRYSQKWMQRILTEHWGSPQIISRGVEYQADLLPGYTAFRDDKPVGLITYYFEDGICEIVTLNAFFNNKGIGTALVKSVIKKMNKVGCKKIWLVTTNDNTEAIRFCQKRGFRLVAVHRYAIRHSRKLKPEIPKRGKNGIPIRDEIELELVIKNKN